MSRKPTYRLNDNGEFIIGQYNLSKPFANFFPGIAGTDGIPMWVFYVNRGQGIISFGTKDKDHSILEFLSANKAWQAVSLQGFRTFLKVGDAKTKRSVFYEPFQDNLANTRFCITNRMLISPSGLRLEEENEQLGIGVAVEYFTVPRDSYAGLVRVLTVKNTGSRLKTIQVLDGLPQIVPYGLANLFLKKLGRTIQAWMEVKNLENSVPFYKLDVDPTDRPEVIHIEGGNFYLSFCRQGRKPRIIKPIIDPDSVFGPVTDYSYPHLFLSNENFRPPRKEIVKSKTPCAFSYLKMELAAHREQEISSIIGNMRSLQALNASVPRLIAPAYLAVKRKENEEIAARLEGDIDTKSGSREFDLYAKQTYLDNIMRGGYPVTTPSGSDSVFYVYSRKHGDLERDYNKFQIQPTYFSQGNGNYRDTNQNRRMDIWFNPRIGIDTILTFFNLIQADGFNPLVVKVTCFTLENPAECKAILKGLIKDADIPRLVPFLSKQFTPGDLCMYLADHGIQPRVSYDELLSAILPACIKYQEAEHGEGFWTDHWTYTLDLLEQYFGVFPEKLREIVFDTKAFTYFDNTEVVKPRREKYVIKEGALRQQHGIHSSNSKRELIRKRAMFPHLVRTDCGKGEIYYTTLINKLLCLAANKLASLDPFGVGIEMEADKPNWFDALNGLPALLGSSLNETFELKRLLLVIRASLEACGVKKLPVTEEVYTFLGELGSLLDGYFSADARADKEFLFWDAGHSAKEAYREKTKCGFSGNETAVEADALLAFLGKALKKLEIGIARAQDKETGVYYAYFINEATAWEPLTGPFVKPTGFVQKRLPFFLESQMHALRLTDNTQSAARIFAATRKSPLFDKPLKMYKVTASLASMPEEIGRCRVFTPGWLEHESIWLHMEYKYLLEVLKKGLYREFYEDFRNALIPFQPPARYGRNILENSSFLVSSAFPDKRIHGNGFVARLSGSTAEFLNIWLVMNIGREPFFLNDKQELNLRLEPALAGWLFDKKDCYSFNFLSAVRATYHNPGRKDTFTKDGSLVRPKRIAFTDQDGSPQEVLSYIVPAPYASQIRERRISRIDVYF